jgi:hypothetical protein
MPFDCPICGKDCRDNYNLERHMKRNHIGDSASGGSSTELKDIRLMLQAEEDEYIFNHPYYREKDGDLYTTKLLENEMRKNYILKSNWKLKSGKQIGIDKKKIDEEYGLRSDEELDETSESYNERYKKLLVVEYEGSYQELNKIQDEMEIYTANLPKYSKILHPERQRKVKDFVRTRIINELEAKDAAEEAIKKQVELEAAKLDRMRREMELKMEMAMLKMKK